MQPNIRAVTLGAVVCLVFPLAASAKPGGISGFSGQLGQTCDSCHGGGAAPTVTVEGPATVQPGVAQQYTLVIKGGPASAGAMDVSVDDPSARLQAGAGSKLMGSELTQSAPKAFANGEARFPFTVFAPPAPGVMTLYAAGMSTNGNGGSSGDGVASTQLQIQIAAAANPGTPAPSPSPAPGTPNPDPSASPAPSPAPDPTAPTQPLPDFENEQTIKSGCTSAAGAPAALAALAALASLAGVRRRRNG